MATGRPNALYHRGELVTFSIALLRNGRPQNGETIKWILSKDGVSPRQEGTAILEDGKAEVKGHLDEPGFLRCEVEYLSPSGKKLTALAAAAVDPLEIQPSLPPPDDFTKFWDEQKRMLGEIPLRVRMSKVPFASEKVECFDVQADCLGAPVSGYLARPRGAGPKSLPAILLPHGAGVSSSHLSLAVQWAKDGFLALDFNAHGLPNGLPNEFYARLYEGELNDYFRSGRNSRETYYFLGIFRRVVRAIDVLAAQSEWDGKILAVNGRSQGGALAIVAAGLDPRVTFLSAELPALCDHTGPLIQRTAGWPQFPLEADGRPLASTLETARYYDAVNFAAHVRIPAIFVSGFIDTACPPTSVYAAYNNLSGPKEIFGQPLVGHTDTPEAAEKIRKAVLQHVTQMRNQGNSR